MNFQFCVECGHQNSRFDDNCSKCGFELVLTIIDPAVQIEKERLAAEKLLKQQADQAEKDRLLAEAEAKKIAAKAEEERIVRQAEEAARKLARAPMMRKIKLGAAAVALLTITGIVLVNIPWPKSVSIEVAIDAPNGGVFDEGCSLTDQAKEAGINRVSALNVGQTPEPGSGSELAFTDVDGTCVGKASVSVAPGATYEVYVGKTRAGDLTLQEIEDGNSQESVPLQVDHVISGTIVLADNYTNCKDTSKGPDCKIPSNVTIQANVVKNVCYGKNSMADIAQAGSPIKFTGKKTGKSASAKLSAGIPSLTDYKTGLITCTYTYEIEGVLHDDSGYAVKIGKHSVPAVSVDELKTSNWIYDYTFKN